MSEMPALGWRWVIVIGRIGAIMLWFGLIIAPHLLLTLAGRRHIVPPVFLAGVGRLAGLVVTTQRHRAVRPVLLVANHVSWLDILALAGAARATFVANDALQSHPALHWLCAQNETVFIARDQRGTVATQVGAIEAGLGRHPMVIFPEGTTGDGRQLMPFKSALLAAAARVPSGKQVAVQPVALRYRDAEQIAWVGDEPGLSNVMRVLARPRPVRLTIIYLEPLGGKDMADRKTIARAAQAAIDNALGH